LLKVIQVTQQIARCGVSEIAVLRQTLPHHIIMRRRQLRIETARDRRFLVNDLEHHSGGIARERFLPGEHRENDDPQREDVRAAINFASLDLFR
jgi:hypothetical protein